MLSANPKIAARVAKAQPNKLSIFVSIILSTYKPILSQSKYNQTHCRHTETMSGLKQIKPARPLAAYLSHIKVFNIGWRTPINIPLF